MADHDDMQKKNQATMIRFFTSIYDWFDRRPIAFYAVLTLLTAACIVPASQIEFQEDISSFFNNGNGQEHIFDNIKAKDKILVMVSGASPDSVIEASQRFTEVLSSLDKCGLIKSVTDRIDRNSIGEALSFIYSYLPIFLDDRDYARLENKICKDSITSAVANVYALLTSPAGIAVGDIMLRDPLNIGTDLPEQFLRFLPELEYTVYKDRIFTDDLSSMLIFIDPTNGMGDTGNNNDLVSYLETAAVCAGTDEVNIKFIGGPVIAVYNARQIKTDTTVTLSIALVIILSVIFLSFRNKRSVPLVIIPPLFGAVFALAAVWLIQGGISAIAIGAGSVVIGISMSYSTHIISHTNHISSPHLIIEELSKPLTIGCLTTIGAFAALIFTSSPILQDLGLFSVFALTGTTLFCLVFMPHFLKGMDNTGDSRLLSAIERFNEYSYDSNKWIITAVFIAAVTSLFFYDKVEFDDNLSNINYMPQDIVEAERQSVKITGDESNNIWLVSSSENLDGLISGYTELEELLYKLRDSSLIEDFTTAGRLIVSPREQSRRIDRWNTFWATHKEETLSLLNSAAAEYGFRKEAFKETDSLLSRTYTICRYSTEETADIPGLSEWIDSTDGTYSILSRISIEENDKDSVYSLINECNGTAVIDRAYFSSIMVEHTSRDFNNILLISSIIVFAALLLSYGRIELTLLTFLPMAVSWTVILGLMAVLDIKFNIINIILATFIFGIGDDFSIFIMDGLLQEYKNGQKTLRAHKTAIFFSAFTAIVGMGVLIFAKHPALKSIATISVLGLCVVVLVSYTVQPFLFKALISSQTKKGNFPYTVTSILNTAYCFLYFFIGCVFAQLYMLVLLPLPINRNFKKRSVHQLLYRFTRIFLNSMITVRIIRNNPYRETFTKPAVIIANHQSFIDILLLLSTTPRLVMVTNSWVWNSPFFGWVIRYADFQHSKEGFESMSQKLERLIKDGYSVVVFPEGTRSADCRIKRFHKGAFYLANRLRLDILPVIIYGAGMISAKNQGFYIKKGIISVSVMERIPFGDSSFGTTYQEQTVRIRKWITEQYEVINLQNSNTDNRYFRDALIKNYIYKGPVLEWYMRIKCRMDGYYKKWDSLIPRSATITDIGCGYGQTCLMLGLLSPDRRILGIDYDQNKIDIASHAFSCKENVSFIRADMREYPLPSSDIFLFNDSLHYVERQVQLRILTEAAEALNDGGMILIKDSDRSIRNRHRRIEKIEIWSTKIMHFNKIFGKMEFLDRLQIKQFATNAGLSMQVDRWSTNSAETLFILKKTQNGKI